MAQIQIIYNTNINGYSANFDFSNNQSVSIFDWINETCDTISVTTPPDDDDDDDTDSDSDDSSEDGDTEDSPANDIEDDILDSNSLNNEENSHSPILMGVAPYSNTIYQYSIDVSFFSGSTELNSIDESDQYQIANVNISPQTTKQFDVFVMLCYGTGGTNFDITVD